MLRFGAGAHNAGDFIPFDGRGRSLAQARRYRLAPRVNQNRFRCCATTRQSAANGYVMDPLAFHMKDCVGDCSVRAYVGKAAASN